MTAFAICATALLLDHFAGEPRRLHPLVGFGALARQLEEHLNRSDGGRTISGSVAVALLVIPPVVSAALLLALLPPMLAALLDTLVLWLALGLRSLTEHARAVLGPLRDGDPIQARHRVGHMVSRDTTELDQVGVATATTESVLENGADAVFASLFWYLVAGAPGVILHRLVNTLDAMWGYRTPRFERFGKAAARLDDVLNWIPARLTALSYALAGDTRTALHCWRQQASAWSSPNAGPVMAAGAGALGVTLGGEAHYHGSPRLRPMLGKGAPAAAATLEGAIQLLRHALLVWLGVMFTVALA